MYKVFFNDRTIYLDDALPDMTRIGKDYVCAFENITDLKPQVRQFLNPEKQGNLYIFHTELETLMNTFRKCFINVPAAGGLVRNPAGEMLVIFRRGKWDLPKGKAETGETMEQTAVREVEEECGLRGIELQELLLSTHHIYEGPEDFILKKTHWYSMLYTGSDDPSPSQKEGISEVRWIGTGQVDEIFSNTYDSIREVIGKAMQLPSAAPE